MNEVALKARSRWFFKIFVQVGEALRVLPAHADAKMFNSFFKIIQFVRTA